MSNLVFLIISLNNKYLVILIVKPCKKRCSERLKFQKFFGRGPPGPHLTLLLPLVSPPIFARNRRQLNIYLSID